MSLFRSSTGRLLLLGGIVLVIALLIVLFVPGIRTVDDSVPAEVSSSLGSFNESNQSSNSIPVTVLDTDLVQSATIEGSTGNGQTLNLNISFTTDLYFDNNCSSEINEAGLRDLGTSVISTAARSPFYAVQYINENPDDGISTQQYVRPDAADSRSISYNLNNGITDANPNDLIFIVIDQLGNSSEGMVDVLNASVLFYIKDDRCVNGRGTRLVSFRYP